MRCCKFALAECIADLIEEKVLVVRLRSSGCVLISTGRIDDFQFSAVGTVPVVVQSPCSWVQCSSAALEPARVRFWKCLLRS
jgi:hypothetical protein